MSTVCRHEKRKGEGGGEGKSNILKSEDVIRLLMLVLIIIIIIIFQCLFKNNCIFIRFA